MKSKKIHLSVPEPCHEDWNKMTPKDQGAFCKSCEKVVIDFSTMSDRELIAYFEKMKGQKTCGKFKNTQLNKNISVVEPAPTYLIKLRQFFIGLFLGLSIPSFLKAENFSFKKPTSHYLDQAPINTPKIIKGIVENDKGEKLPFAIVGLKQNDKFLGIGANTDIDGNFTFEIPDSIQYENLQISFRAFGFETQVLSLQEEDWFEIVMKKETVIDENIDHLSLIEKDTVEENVLEEVVVEVAKDIKYKCELPIIKDLDFSRITGITSVSFYDEKEDKKIDHVIFPETIRGRVVDENNEALVFANIIIKNQKTNGIITGVTTDLDGYFELQLNDSIRLENEIKLDVMYIGYENKNFQLNINEAYEELEIVLNTSSIECFTIGLIVSLPEKIDENSSGSFPYSYLEIEPKWKRYGFESKQAYKGSKKKL